MSEEEFPVIARVYPGGILVGFYDENGNWVNIMGMTKDLIETGVSL